MGETIVVKAEAQEVLPGLGRFMKAAVSHCLNARKKTADAKLAQWNLCRAIHEFAKGAEVRAKVAILCAQAKERKLGGRPPTASGLVRERLIAAGMVSKGSLDRWMGEWYVAAYDGHPPHGVATILGIDPGCTAEGFSSQCGITSHEQVEAILEKLAAQRSIGADEPETPEDARAASVAQAEALARRIGQLFGIAHPDDKPRVNRPALYPIVQIAIPILESHGYRVTKEHAGSKPAPGPKVQAIK